MAGERLSRSQEQAIAALLVCPTVIAAAEKAGVHHNTLRGWLKLPEFTAAFEEARHRVLEASVNFLQEGMAAGLRAMIRDTESEDFEQRFRATQLIFETATKGVEIGSLLPRLRALEARDADAARDHGPIDPAREPPPADPPAPAG